MAQSGIVLTQAVRDFFHEHAKLGDLRWFQLVFNNENLEIAEKLKATDSEQADFDAMNKIANDSIPSYFIFKYEQQWLLILFVPDTSKVKIKMLMSSTADTIKNNLGYQNFVGMYHCTNKNELTYAEWKAHWAPKAEAHKFHESVRTEKERQQMEEKSLQHFDGPSKSNIKGLSFPLEDEAKDALTKFASKAYKFAALKIEDEILKLDVAAEEISADEIAQHICATEPRFCFYTYTHEYQDNVIDSTFMIYSCPTATKVKNRMIYSASKSSVQSLLAEFGVSNFDKNMEISDLKDLTEAYLHDMIHGSAAVLGSKDAFSKPKRPVAARRPAKK